MVFMAGGKQEEKPRNLQDLRLFKWCWECKSLVEVYPKEHHDSKHTLIPEDITRGVVTIEKFEELIRDRIKESDAEHRKHHKYVGNGEFQGGFRIYCEVHNCEFLRRQKELTDLLGDSSHSQSQADSNGGEDVGES